MICSRCEAEWELNAERCVVCGASRQSAETRVRALEQLPTVPRVSEAVVDQPPRAGGIADNPYVVLATIFFVTAAFGIPLIWMCPAWSTRTKWLLTGITIAYTIFILSLFSMVMMWCYERIRHAI